MFNKHSLKISHIITSYLDPHNLPIVRYSGKQRVSIIINIIKKFIQKSKSKRHTVDHRYVISSKNHCIRNQHIHSNALIILEKLLRAGYQAYLVGGSVRDILIQQTPKDFDIATNATPQQIKKLFRNARIIGRRFKLIHITYHRDVIEVATFRAYEPVSTDLQVNDKGMLIQDNVYGTLEEDVLRRDFTVNALYYDMTDQSIVDFTQGLNDIQEKVIRIIGDPTTRYQEDPVRMLRAVRLSAKLGFTVESQTAEPINHLNHLIAHVSNSRLFDEIVKMYQCGQSLTAQALLEQYGLFPYLFPLTAELASDIAYPIKTLLLLALESTDNRIQQAKPVNPAFVFAILLWFPVQLRVQTLCQQGILPYPAFEQAVGQILNEQCRITSIPKRHTQTIRDIWMLQSRFEKRHGHRAHQLMQHPKFRAAYDFLALRALAKDAPVELAQWWTHFQEAEPPAQEKMIRQCSRSQSEIES